MRTHEKMLGVFEQCKAALDDMNIEWRNVENLIVKRFAANVYGYTDLITANGMSWRKWWKQNFLAAPYWNMGTMLKFPLKCSGIIFIRERLSTFSAVTSVVKCFFTAS